MGGGGSPVEGPDLLGPDPDYSTRIALEMIQSL
jgi:hypothetical protein